MEVFANLLQRVTVAHTGAIALQIIQELTVRYLWYVTNVTRSAIIVPTVEHVGTFWPALNVAVPSNGKVRSVRMTLMNVSRVAATGVSMAATCVETQWVATNATVSTDGQLTTATRWWQLLMFAGKDHASTVAFVLVTDASVRLDTLETYVNLTPNAPSIHVGMERTASALRPALRVNAAAESPASSVKWTSTSANSLIVAPFRRPHA